MASGFIYKENNTQKTNTKAKTADDYYNELTPIQKKALKGFRENCVDWTPKLAKEIVDFWKLEKNYGLDDKTLYIYSMMK